MVFGSSLHELLQAERSPTTDSAVSCSDLNELQQGLGQAWLDAIAPQEDKKLSRRFAWSGLDVDSLRRVLAHCSKPAHQTRILIISATKKDSNKPHPGYSRNKNLAMRKKNGLILVIHLTTPKH